MIKNKQDEPEKPDKKLEYTTCIDFVKYSGGVQLALFSFFSVLMSGFAYFLFGNDKPDEPILTILKFAALLFSLGLWVGEESHAYLVSKFFCRARNLEAEMGFHAVKSLPPITPFWNGPTNWSLRVIYLLVTLFWLLSALPGVL